MRKIFLILVSILFIFISCNNKDSERTNPIIGTWQTWSNKGKELDSCAKKSTYNFYKDGKLKIIRFKKHDSKCSFDKEIIGSWKNKGNNHYEFNFNKGDINFFILFSDNNKTFKLSGSKNEFRENRYNEFRKR